MSTNFTAIELASLPAPKVIETLDYEDILATIKADFAARYPGYTADLESDPVVKLLEAVAYREVTLRQRVNDAAKAVMLAFATGTDLDNLAALVPVERNAGETDASFRGRVQLAPEAFSVAGPHGAYRFHGLSASTNVKDVGITSPAPGDVLVHVLSRKGDGTPAYRETVTGADYTLSDGSVTLEGKAIDTVSVAGATAGIDYAFAPGTGTVHRLDGGTLDVGATLSVTYDRAAETQLVELALTDEDVRPLTDNVTVQPATILTYTVGATLTVYEGPDAEVVRQAAVAAVEDYAEKQHRMGYDVTLSGLYQALHRPGVQSVALTSPAASVVAGSGEAAYCASVTVDVGGTGV